MQSTRISLIRVFSLSVLLLGMQGYSYARPPAALGVQVFPGLPHVQIVDFHFVPASGVYFSYRTGRYYHPMKRPGYRPPHWHRSRHHGRHYRHPHRHYHGHDYDRHNDRYREQRYTRQQSHHYRWQESGQRYDRGHGKPWQDGEGRQGYESRHKGERRGSHG